jgi:hypothetical protein
LYWNLVLVQGLFSNFLKKKKKKKNYSRIQN